MLGIVLCGFLAATLSGRPGVQFVVAGVLLGVGVLLWLANYLVVGTVKFDPANLDNNN